jgi:RNA-binding protein with serine-rich domain 1
MSTPPRRSASRGQSPVRAPSDRMSRSPTPRNGVTHRSQSRSRSRGRTRSKSFSRSPSRSLSPDRPASAKIVIEKLTKNVQPAHLREIFSTYGPVTAIDMPMNKAFMTNRGIAYVVYESPEHAESAIAHMHEAQLDGAVVSVSIVLPRRRFSRSPPGRRAVEDRFGEPRRFREERPRGGGGRGGGSYRGSGRAGGYRDRYDDRYDDRDSHYRPRSYSPPPMRRRRSRSYDSRSRSRTPPRRRDASPPRRRRSPSYSSYDSRERSLSRDRGRGRR